MDEETHPAARPMRWKLAPVTSGEWDVVFRAALPPHEQVEEENRDEK